MLILILLLKLTLSQQQDQEIFELKIEKQYEFYGKVPGSSKSVLYPVHFYKFVVENVVPNEDIFVVLRALHDQSSYPSLYMSKENQYPSIQDELCGNKGMDVCVIEEHQLIANTTYYLGVYCLQDCDYELTIHYEEEEVLELGEAIIVRFENETENELKINLPREMDGVDRILVRAHYIQDKNSTLNESFHFYINEGNETPSPSKYQYQAEEIWMVGKGVVIYKNSTNLKGNLTILLIGVPNTRLYFLSTFYERIRDIGLFERTDDLVIERKTNYYRLQIQDDYLQYLNGNSLSFDIHPFEGNPDVYISPCQKNECSLDYKQYPWQSQLDLGFESITISPNNRINNGNGSEFIIAINGVEDFSSYSFVAYLSNYFSRSLSVYSFESGFLVKNELAEYVVEIHNQYNQTFTITANYPKGHGIIILKKCLKNKDELNNVTNHFSYIFNAGPDNFYNCSITQEEIEKIQMGQILKSGTSELYATENILQFFYNKFECENNVIMLKYETVHTNCQYVVGIYSNVEFMNYQIFLKGQEQHILLKESTTHRSFLLEYETDLFSFIIEDDDVIEVVFQIAAITGEYEAYASRTHSKPNSTFYDNYANMELDVLQYKPESESSNLAGYYYIRIISKSLLRYSITPIVYRKSHYEINYIHLTESIPYIHLQTKIDQVTYFNFEYRQNGPLFIHLNGIYGHFICYLIGTNKVIGDKIPDQTQYDFTLRSSQHTLIIENPKQYYYLQINSISLGLNESYEIQFTSSSSLMELFYGEPLITQLDNQHQSYYYYQSPYNLENLFIVRTYITEINDQNNLQVFISLKNKYPNQQNCDFQLNDSTTYIMIQNITQSATVYIGIYSQGYNEFSLLIRGVSGIIELQDNAVQQIPIPSFEQYQQSNLYFLIPQSLNNTIQVQAYTEFTEIELFGSIKDYSIISKELKNNNHKIFPNSSNHDITEESSASISNKLLIIKQEDLQNCKNYKQGCVLLITVKLDQQSLYSYLQNNTYNNISTVDGEDGYFNIMISTQFTIIRNGEMLIGYSGENIMSYYYFYVDSPVEFIQIAARPIDDCDPDIYVNKLINDTISYPTEDSNTYKSMQYKSDILIIREQDNVGSYLIGISGFKNECTFELMLNFADIELYYISNGQFVSHHINQTVYYFYQHSRKESFRIMIQGMSNIDVAINTYSQYSESEDGLFDLLPYYGTDNIQMLFEHNDNLFGGIIQISSQDQHFCYYCTYLIALKPLKTADIQLLIAYNSLALEIEYGRIYYDQCVESCKYYIEPGDLNIFVYSQDVQLHFYEEETLVFSMNLTNYKHTIPINASYILMILNPNENAIASYWMILQSESDFVSLHLGKSYNGNNTKESNITKFTFTPITADQWYTIVVQSKSSIQVQLYYMSKNVTEFILINPVQEWSVSKSIQEFKYQLPSVNDFYKIELQCSGSYSIKLNLDGLKYIDSNYHYIEQIQSPQIYDMYGIKGQELFIEKIDCLGQTHINMTTYKFNNSTDIYFNITPTLQANYIKNGVSLKKNIYSLVPHLQYSNDVWYFNQTINYEISQNEDQTLNVTVDAMKRNRTGILELKMIVYQLHYSNQENLMQAFGCQMDIESLKYYTNSQLYHNKQLLTVKESDDKVFFQITIPQDFEILYGLIVFQAFYQGYDTPYTYFYNSSLILNKTQAKTEIDKKQNGQEENPNLFVYLIVVVTLLVLSILIFGIRRIIQKKQQAKLDKSKNATADEEWEQVKAV